MGTVDRDLNIDVGVSREARAEAYRLIAAHFGGRDSYLAEFNRIFGGKRNLQDADNYSHAIDVVNALVEISSVLSVVASEEEDWRTMLDVVEKVIEDQKRGGST
jgi:hypothetical protein